MNGANDRILGASVYLGRMRCCGLCNADVIPYGVDWPYWIDGKPVCAPCMLARALEIARCDSLGDDLP